MPNPPKPKALKDTQGTFRSDRAQANEPETKQAELTPPQYLSPEAQEAFKRLSKEFNQMRVLTTADGQLLEILCETYAEYQKLRSQIDTEGFTIHVTSTQGDTVPKANPAVTMMQKSRDQILSMLREFGATPSARTKVSAITIEEDDPLTKFLNSKH